MPNTNREDKSFVDGLPVKITEKFKRPPIIKLPVVCQNCSPNPIIYEEYDFRLERSVLSKMEEWKKARQEQFQRREERRKELKAMNETEKPKDGSPTDCKSPQDVPSSQKDIEPSILTPSTVGSMSEEALKPLPNYFNFSEFESDNSSPFDNMELKTINDMEVLASVLSSSSDAMPPSQEKTSHSLINNNFIPSKNGVVYNKWEGYNTYSSPQYYAQNYSYPAMYSPVVYPQQPQPHWYVGDSVASQPSPYFGSSSIPSAHDYHCDAGTIPKVKEESIVNNKSNSKSVPDLVLELQEELKEKQFFDEQRRKTKTPPPRPSLLNSTGLENWKPWPELESPHHSAADFDDTLTSTEQILAKRVSEMGFPIARVIRTIKKFQGDDKKVIDFLLQVQRLEEESFPGDMAEKALHANNYDIASSKKHLEAVVTLLDLGFDAESIEEALINTNNDRDAALERLIT